MKATLVTLAATLAVTNGMTGEDACENRGLNEQQCAAVGCCHFNPELGCMSSVGQSTCHDNAEMEPEYDVPLGLDLGRRLDAPYPTAEPTAERRLEEEPLPTMEPTTEEQLWGRRLDERVPTAEPTVEGRRMEEEPLPTMEPTTEAQLYGRRLESPAPTAEPTAEEEWDVPLGLDLGRRLESPAPTAEPTAEGLVRRLNQPTHKELQDLAALTEMEISMETEQAEEVMKQTGLTEESMVEIGRDIVIDAMADLPDDMFLKVQKQILIERLGYVPESLLEDMDKMHSMIPEDRRRMDKKPWTFWVDFTNQLLSGLLTTVGQLGSQFTNNDSQ